MLGIRVILEINFRVGREARPRFQANQQVCPTGSEICFGKHYRTAGNCPVWACCQKTKKARPEPRLGNVMGWDYFFAASVFVVFSFTSVAPLPRRLRR